MSRSHSDDLDLDALVDDIARQMTGGQPRSGLQARVAARLALDEGASVRGPRPHAWLLTWAAAAAALALAVYVVREARQSSPPARSSSVRSEPAPREPHMNSAATTTAVVQRDDGARVVRLAGGNAATRRAVPPPPDPELEPLTLAPLEVDRLDVSPIARADAIEIRPVAIERIEIAAMP